MGCDIHAHIELKINGIWHHWSSPDINRDYTLFARLAGVRTNNPKDRRYPIRPLPEDMTVLTRMVLRRFGNDAHTESFITGDEMTEVANWYATNIKHPFSRIFGWGLGNGFSAEGLKEDGVEEARMIFWFDN